MKTMVKGQKSGKKLMHSGTDTTSPVHGSLCNFLSAGTLFFAIPPRFYPGLLCRVLVHSTNDLEVCVRACVSVGPARDRENKLDRRAQGPCS